MDGRTYARTYVRTYGHLRPALLGLLCRVEKLEDELQCPNIDVDAFATSVTLTFDLQNLTRSPV